MVILDDLRALFVDAHCKVCHRPLITGEVAVCNDCLASLRLFDVRHLTSPHSFLDYKLEHVGRIRRAAALMIYKKGGISQTLIHDFKYHGCHRYAFSVKNPELFNNKRILLIDDVFTSGSTIIDCCRALDSVPNLDILVYTLAYAEE